MQVSTAPLRELLELYQHDGGKLEDLARRLQARFPRHTRYAPTWARLLHRIHSGGQERTDERLADQILIELGCDLVAIYDQDRIEAEQASL